DDATDVPLGPTFTWNAAAQAATYLLEVSTASNFSEVVYSATVSGTSHTVVGNLPSSSRFFWRVRGDNSCGQGGVSATRTFTTVALPGDCAVGTVAVPQYEEDFETGAGGWTTGGTGSTWQIETGDANSGTEAFQADNVDVVSDQYLISPAQILPAATSPLDLLFFTKMDIEDQSNGDCYDGGVVEISTDGGANWIRLEAEIVLEAYDGVVDDGYNNPISNENAWCGQRLNWTRFVVDISSFGGQTAQFRFRLATDQSVDEPGWWIDDVSVNTCVDAVAIIGDAFESGHTENWSHTAP
ncbi:MAG: immune inhibitor A, partial [Holophagales bacterium]|nr:immune inhibitor A [Holophagales bacterium]